MTRSVLVVNGKDSSRFLGNIITNKLPEISNSSYSLLLNSQGKYLFDFFIIKKAEESYLIDISSRRLLEFINILNLYKLRMNVEIIKTDYISVYSNQNLQNFFISFNDPRFNKLGKRYIFLNPLILNLKDNIEYLEDKYKYSIPDDIDLIYEVSMPLEYSLEKLNAIDYTKGCYVGQEVIAHSTYRGVIRKGIYKVTAQDNIESLKPGLEIIGDKANKVGVLCSSYKNLGIALVNKEEYSRSRQFKIQDISINLEIPLWLK